MHLIECPCFMRMSNTFQHNSVSLTAEVQNMQYFNQEDKFMLNEVGACLLKEVLFAHTGFVKNN